MKNFFSFFSFFQREKEVREKRGVCGVIRKVHVVGQVIKNTQPGQACCIFIL